MRWWRWSLGLILVARLLLGWCELAWRALLLLLRRRSIPLIVWVEGIQSLRGEVCGLNTCQAVLLATPITTRR